MADPKVNVIFKGTDNLSGMTGLIAGGLSNLASISFAAAGAGIIALGAGIIEVSKKAVAMEPVQNTFDNLFSAIGEDSTAAIKKLREGTKGMVNDFDLMQSGNKFMAMGLAKTGDEAAGLAKIATQLGTAMGTDATTAMSDFAMMLANQSIERLDTFGISSGKARVRIEELKKAGYQTDEAFKMAVMEQAGAIMDKLGDQSNTASGKMAQFKATSENLKTVLGEIFLPVLTDVMDTFGKLALDAMPAVQTFVADAQVKFGAFAEYLKTDFITDVKQFFSVDGDMANMNFFEWVSAFTVKIAGEMQPIIDGMTAWLTSATVKESMNTAGVQVGTFITDGIKNLFQSENGASSVVTELATGIGQSSTNMVIAIQQLGIDFATGVVEGILIGFGMDELAASRITLKLNETLDKVVEWINPFEIGKKIINNIIEGINSFKYLIGQASSATITNPLTGAKTTYTPVGSSTRTAGGRASGGLVMPGMLYGVKEDEGFVPNTSGQIVPSNKTSGNSGNVTINLSISSFIPPNNPQELERLLSPAVKNIFRNQYALRN
jgi:hypothetical protein